MDSNDSNHATSLVTRAEPRPKPGDCHRAEGDLEYQRLGGRAERRQAWSLSGGRGGRVGLDYYVGGGLKVGEIV